VGHRLRAIELAMAYAVPRPSPGALPIPPDRDHELASWSDDDLATLNTLMEKYEHGAPAEGLEPCERTPDA
jgi:hypothetical protein